MECEMHIQLVLATRKGVSTPMRITLLVQGFLPGVVLRYGML
jgi:hypothetical protein